MSASKANQAGQPTGKGRAMLLTVLRGLRDVFLIFTTPILVVWLIFAVLTRSTSPETTPLSAALVMVGWILLTWFLALRPAWYPRS